MKTVNIKSTTALSEYRNILVSELEETTGQPATALSRASINRNEVVVYAKIGNKKYKGFFKVWDRTLTVTNA
jgi:hypothetical protein